MNTFNDLYFASRYSSAEGTTQGCDVGGGDDVGGKIIDIRCQQLVSWALEDVHMTIRDFDDSQGVV